MRTFLSIAAILAWLIGAMLLVMLYQPTGLVLTPLVATIAQAHGATLVGLGVVNWIARTAAGRALVAVLAGNLVTQVLSLFVVLQTMSLGAGAGVAPAVVIHVCLGAGFAWFLLRSLREAS